MNFHNYSWERRWLPIIQETSTLKHPYEYDRSGFIVGYKWSSVNGLETVGETLEQLGEKIKCAVLLGEPGMGKSNEWEKQKRTLSGSTNHLFLDLGSFDSAESLRQELMASPEVVAWKDSESFLTIWMDSLDEGLLHITKLQDAIIRCLEKLDVERLRLRVTCRNAIWPISFSESLQKLLGIQKETLNESFKVLLLSPLTKQQVKEAIEVEGFDVDQFFGAVSKVDAQPLVNSPVTLRLLINLFKAHKPTFGISETAGRAGLYERGCLELCEMPDRDRDEKSRFEGKERLLLAGYLAFLAVLTNRRQIHIEPVSGVLGLNDLDPYEIGAGKTALMKGVQAIISQASIRDLLRNTGLFTDLGHGQMVWTHQSYAEFLAAWYLNHTGIPSKSLRTIFRSNTDPSGGIVPALQETAAWLSDINSEFWSELLELDPMALVHSDLRRLNNKQRAAVVNRVIEWLGNLSYSPFSANEGFMRELNHPNLAEQLRPILIGLTTSDAVQRFVADMILACEVTELVPDLVSQALDEAVAFSKRARAMDLLVDLADDDARKSLRQLCFNIPVEDKEDEFRGDLLRILWPSHLPLDELLPLITREKDTNFIGSYRYFLGHFKDIEVQLSLDATLESLRWLVQNISGLNRDYRKKEFWDEVLSQVWGSAWKFVNEPQMLELMTEFFIIAYKYHHKLSAKGVLKFDRLKLFTNLLHRKDRSNPVSVSRFNFDEGNLITHAEWVELHSLIFSPLKPSQREWLTRILMFLLGDTPLDNTHTYGKRYDQLLETKRRFASSRRAFYTVYSTVDLDSPEAKENQKWSRANIKKALRQLHEKRKRRIQTLHEITVSRKRLREIVAKGNSIVFHEWQELLDVFSTEKSDSGFLAHYDLSKSKPWSGLYEKTRKGIANLAIEIVSRYHIPPKEWYALGGGVSYGAIALYRALLLSNSQSSNQVNSLTIKFWEDWSSFIIQMEGYADKDYNFELVKMAALAAPREVDRAIFLHADGHDSRGPEEKYYRLKDWNRALPKSRYQDFMLEAIVHGVWSETFSASVLVELLEIGHHESKEFGVQLLPDSSTYSGWSIQRPVLVVEVYSWLLFNSKKVTNDAWNYWERLSNFPDLTETVISRSVHHPRPRDLQQLAVLNEVQLCVLVLWLTYAFQLSPEDVDDWKNRSSKGRISALRSATLSELASRGTIEAWDILNQLSLQMGEPYWIRFRIDDVRENLRRNSWEPIAPDALIALAQDLNHRWVKSASDLQELVLESIDRFQADLHDVLVAAEVLWIPVKDQDDKRKTVGYEVRSENFLSNVLQRHLVQDLQRADVLVKREVEIRPAFGAGSGQRTDIFIDAFTLDESGNKVDVVTVVIEVKLSKNDEVETALNNQLIPYLNDQKYKHGIYLVGWHYGEHDRKPSSVRPLPELHSLLKQQTLAVGSAFKIRSRLLDIRLPGDKERREQEKLMFESI